MKQIAAYIKTHKLDRVLSILRKIDKLTGMSVLYSSGFGRGWGADDREADCRPGIKLEIICSDDLVDETVTAIEKAAHTGLKGDGKIYVSNIEQAVRISTGERGEKAV